MEAPRSNRPAGQTTWILGKGPWADLAFWVVYALLNHLVFAPIRFEPGNLLVSAVLASGQTAATYTHIKWLLLPQLNGRLHTVIYVSGLLVLVAVSALLLLASLAAVFFFTVGLALDVGDLGPFGAYWFAPVLGGLGMTLAITAGMLLYARGREQQKREVQLTATNQRAELAYLRGQLNPHFLFNALNSIYVLIPRNPDGAREALSGFSDLLRYQLYQGERKLVGITEELAQLEQFAQLNLLRMEEGFTYDVDYNPEELDGKIAPLLLLPLLENAFKYSPKLNGSIWGTAEVVNGIFTYVLSNEVTDQPVVETTASGVGLVNIHRRLELLYPGEHLFAYNEDGGVFTIQINVPVR